MKVSHNIWLGEQGKGEEPAHRLLIQVNLGETKSQDLSAIQLYSCVGSETVAVQFVVYESRHFILTGFR